MSKFLEQCKKWHLKPVYYAGEVHVEGGDITARDHFNTLLQNTDAQVAALLELYNVNEELRVDVDERAAINEIDYGGSGDIETAIRINLQLLPNIK